MAANGVILTAGRERGAGDGNEGREKGRNPFRFALLLSFLFSRFTGLMVI